MITSALPAVLTPISTLGPSWLDPTNMISAFVNWVGPWAVLGVFCVVFAETGLLVGFFLPGDSLLFTLGAFIAKGHVTGGNEGVNVPLGLAIVAIYLGAFLGDQTGYWIGRKSGPKVFDKPDSRLFKQEYVERTNHYFERFGGRTVILARFIPIVRTFAPVAAGVGKMDWRVFTGFSAIGNVLWAPVCILLGYLLGNVPFVEKNIDVIIILVVLLSISPMIVKGITTWLKRRKSKAGAAGGANASDAASVGGEATTGFISTNDQDGAESLHAPTAAQPAIRDDLTASTVLMPAQPSAPPQPPSRIADPRIPD